MKKVC